MSTSLHVIHTSSWNVAKTAKIERNNMDIITKDGLVKPEYCAIQLKLSKHERHRYKVAAMRNGRTVTGLIRDVLRGFIDRDDAKAKERGLSTSIQEADKKYPV